MSAAAAPPEVEIEACVAQLAGVLGSRGWMMAAAESCTGGLLGSACTALAGSSAWFDCGFVTYSNEAKTALLGVPAELIAAHGAVSQAVAQAMAQGALARSRARFAVAVTGIAGPTGGTPDKPVGTVWLAWAERGARPGAGADPAGLPVSERRVFAGDRQSVRQQSVLHALQGLLKLARGAA